MFFFSYTSAYTTLQYIFFVRNFNDHLNVLIVYEYGNKKKNINEYRSHA